MPPLTEPPPTVPPPVAEAPPPPEPLKDALMQDPTRQYWFPIQVLHAAPLLPQKLRPLPGWHSPTLSQQPVQV